MRAIVCAAWICVGLAGCQNKVTDQAAELDDLQRQVVAMHAEYQPKVDALVARVRRLKRDLRGNLPGWEMKVRTAQLANDGLGLEPFEQTVSPGPEWRPRPGALLGIGPYADKRAVELASQGKLDELRFLVKDERDRYDKGIAAADEHLKEVETWLAAAQAAAGSAR